MIESPARMPIKTRLYFAAKIGLPIAKAKALRAVKAAVPVVGNTALRVAKSAAPVVLPFAAGAAAYYVSPDCQEGIDWVRSKLNTYPHISEAVTSGVIMGLGPDLVAQRMEQRESSERGLGSKRLNYRRLAGMTVIGAATGALYLRGLYDLLGWLFPSKGLLDKFRQIASDQFIATPFIYMPLFLMCVNAIMGKTGRNIYQGLRKKINDLLPWNWGFWMIALQAVYRLPQDLQVYAAQGFATIWFSFLSKRAFTPKAQTAPRTPGPSS